MSSGANAGLQHWAEAFAALEPGESEWHFRDNRRVFVDRLRELANDSSTVVLSEQQWDKLAARAAETSQGILWDDEESIEFREALLATLSLLVVRVAANTPKEDFGVGMFWDKIAILARPFDLTALPRLASQARPASPRIFDALFATLGDQLRRPNKQIQVSALRGLVQLGHPQTQELVDSVRDSLADDEVRSAADRAARFELM